MTNLFAKAAFAALLSLGAVGASTATANAGGIDVEIRVGSPGYYHAHRPVYRPVYRPVHVYRPHVGRCQPGLALEKASWRGIHRARVTLIGSNRVVVEGRRGHRWDSMVFANARGCPVLRR